MCSYAWAYCQPKTPTEHRSAPCPPRTRYAKQHAKARRRRYRKAHERLARDRRQAQHAAEALQQALDDLGLPEDLVTEIEGRLRSQQKLLGKIVGVMCPPLFGCRTNSELCRVRGWDKNLPSRLLGALPKRSWLKRLRRLGLEVLVPLWRHAASKSEATRSRWQWTWVADDSVFKKYGDQLGLVGTWWSGQEHRVLSGIDGVLLVVVIGEGKLVVPVDFAIRRPDPTGPGAPCRDKLHWVQVMLDGRVAAFRRRGVALPPPMVVADSWFSDSKLMRHVAMTHQGTFLVEGKSTYVFALPDGRQVKGDDLQQQRDWPWRHSPQVPGVRYARLRATSPTYGAVTLIVVDEHGEEQFYVMCLETDHQCAAAHTGVEAAPLDRVLFSDLEALVGDRRLSGAQRGCLLRPSGLTPDGLLCVVLHLTGDLQRAAHDGGDHLQSEALLALCRLRSS